MRNYDHLSLCPASISYHITSHHLPFSLSDTHTHKHKSKLKVVKADCLLAMTRMMMGSDGADLFVTARLMSNIIKLCTRVCLCVTRSCVCRIV